MLRLLLGWCCRPWRLAGSGWLGGSGGVDGPAGVLVVGQAEGGETGEVDSGGEEDEVGGQTQPAAYAGASSAVVAAYQVRDLAFDFGAGDPVVGLPGGITLADTGSGQTGLMVTDGDGAASLGAGALVAQRAGGAGGAEGGLAGEAGVAGD